MLIECDTKKRILNNVKQYGLKITHLKEIINLYGKSLMKQYYYFTGTIEFTHFI